LNLTSYIISDIEKWETSVNSKIQLAKKRAIGYRNINNFINMIYFTCGKLKFDYPLYPYRANLKGRKSYFNYKQKMLAGHESFAPNHGDRKLGQFLVIMLRFKNEHDQIVPMNHTNGKERWMIFKYESKLENNQNKADLKLVETCIHTKQDYWTDKY